MNEQLVKGVYALLMLAAVASLAVRLYAASRRGGFTGEAPVGTEPVERAAEQHDALPPSPLGPRLYKPDRLAAARSVVRA